MNKGSGKTLKCVTLFTRWLRAIIILPRSCDPEGLSSPFPEWKQQFSQWDRSAWPQPPFQPTSPSQLWWQVQKLSCESSSCDYHNDESVKNVIFKTMCYFLINSVLQTTRKFWLYFFFSPTYQCLWSCWEALNHSGSATSFQYLFSLMFVQCSFVSNFSPRKSELISDSPEPSERLS